MQTKKVNLLFVGKYGGCYVINKIDECDNYVKAYYNLIEYIKRDKWDFFARSEPYNPTPLKINNEIKSILDSIGLKYKSNCDFVHDVCYYNGNSGVICDLYFIENEGKLYFKYVMDKKKSFILTPERFKESILTNYKDLPKVSDEEHKKTLAKILETGEKKYKNP